MEETKRIFVTGDEWLYYKLYCGARTADLILTDTMKPFITSLQKKGWVDQWFFIRYQDPDFHLRIRFHLTDIKHIGEIILYFHQSIQSYVADDIMYRVQTDTYIRELERYGKHTIELSEKLFHLESEMILQAIDFIEDENVYFLFVLKAIDQLLGHFRYELTEKLDIVNRNRSAFWAEFEGDKYLTKQLDKKYRKVKKQLIEFLHSPYENGEYKILNQVLSHKLEESDMWVKTILNNLINIQEIQKDDLITSYIHMLVNRAFRSKQRFYELVCYDFLMKYYKNLMFQKQ
ncbi:thiopeptide-type bacteriocin biosynthesis protein [Aquimarina sp. MMG016]|uniref:thiopeptide-type bacteriocin biosynthesis protein n=1 Tax=Aquimarina sp. MMG016 TaxID=2822690 RepID=UPI001B39D1D4|nr:thiopeptide-type bacteriocin biosynthesis protein [Aquimarina sp. MMG016]